MTIYIYIYISNVRVLAYRYLQGCQYRRQCNAILTLQCFLRSAMARHDVHAKRTYFSATKIQSLFRTYVAYQHFGNKKRQKSNHRYIYIYICEVMVLFVAFIYIYISRGRRGRGRPVSRSVYFIFIFIGQNDIQNGPNPSRLGFRYHVAFSTTFSRWDSREGFQSDVFLMTIYTYIYIYIYIYI
jgi:hypothetical protein